MFIIKKIKKINNIKKNLNTAANFDSVWVKLKPHVGPGALPWSSSVHGSMSGLSASASSSSSSQGSATGWRWAEVSRLTLTVFSVNNRRRRSHFHQQSELQWTLLKLGLKADLEEKSWNYRLEKTPGGCEARKGNPQNLK